VDEIIVVNHSPEEKDEVQKFKSEKVHIYQRPNRGYGNGCNFGAKRAKGDILIFFNPDALALEETIPTLKRELEKSGGVVAPSFLNPDLTFQPSTRKYPDLKHLLVSRNSPLRKLFSETELERDYFGLDLENLAHPLILEDRFPLGGFFMIKRETFEKLGGFDERFFLYFEDTDFFKRVKEAGYPIILVPQAKIIHWHGYSQVSVRLKSNFHKLKSFYLYICKHLKGRFPMKLLLFFLTLVYLPFLAFLKFLDLQLKEKRWSQNGKAESY